VVATSLWQFWVFASLSSTLLTSGVLGGALVADLVPSQAIGAGMSRFDTTTWIGAIIGFAIGGFVIQNLGMTPTFLVSALFPLIAVLLLIPIHPSLRAK